MNGMGSRPVLASRRYETGGDEFRGGFPAGVGNKGFDLQGRSAAGVIAAAGQD